VYRQGNVDAAINAAEAGYRQFERSDPAWSWRFRLLEVEGLLWKGRFKESNNLLAETPPPRASSDITARRKILQGRTLCRIGKPGESGAAFGQAEQLVGIDRYLNAELAFARGKCASLSDRDSALKYYQQSADLARGVDDFAEARGLLDVGNISLHEGNYGEAIRDFNSVLRVTDAALLREPALGDLGFTYTQLGEFRRAVHFSDQAAIMAAQRNNRVNEKKWLIDLGQEHLHQLEYREAEDSFKKALRLAKDLGDQDDTAICLHDLAQLAIKTRDLNKAEDYIRQLDGLHPTGSHYVDLLLNRAELAKARGDYVSAEQLLNQLFEEIARRKDVDPATRWTAQSDLAGVYAGQGKFKPADKMFQAAVATAEATRSKIEGIEYRITFLDYSPFYDQYVKFLVSQNRQLEALAVAEQGRSPTLSEGLSSNGQPRKLDIVRIQAALRLQHQIVLAYWLGWEESYLWVLTPTQVKLFRLPAELEIEKEIEAYNREIIEGGTLENLKERGQGLYRTLVVPAEPYLSKGSSVIIVPHRKLYNLAFYTLVAPAPSPHYWLEDVESHNMSFLSALTSSKPPSTPSKDLLMLGAPLLADKQFPVLQYASTEMEKVGGHFPAAREIVISGKEATPAAYLGSHPGQFRYIHLVTHGTSTTVLENPLDAAIILSPVPGAAASATDPESTYRLYGKDIMKAPLHADLVIISACYGTGREYSGEGLVGLAWAFLRAGAHQVIAALWEVDDASMPQLMDDFYGEYTHGKSAADALRDAKLRMLHSNDFHSRPYYWASLQLYTGS